MIPTELEVLREIFRDVRMHLGIGTIKQLGIATDRSVLRVQVALLPEEREVIAIMGWGAVGNNAGDFSFPQVDDLVIVAFAEGEPDNAFVISRITDKAEPIPAFALLGDMVKYANQGNKLYLGSDTKIAIAKPDHEPTEPLALGNVLITFLTGVLDAILNAPQIGYTGFGPAWLDPGIRSALISLKETYLVEPSTNIVSQIAYTERGT